APLWVGDFEDGGFGQFKDTPWNNLPVAPQAASSPTRAGSFSGAYRITAGGQRSENVPSFRSLQEGDDLWFSFSTRLKDVPLNTSDWQVLAQWKNSGEGSPPLQIALENGDFTISGGWGWPGTDNPSTPKMSGRNLGAAANGQWDDWLIHIRFSSDPSKGTVDVWRNGSQLVSDWRPDGGTLYPDLTSYVKVGYYRSSAINVDSTVFQDQWKIGTTRSSVGA
ncbi:MAG: polysaccharide lyase, partial [Actinomycetia bacterium]|nr:polysaccharide lyase [Actinomycetes bacterium]